jgi:hypothetical protein
MKAGLVLVQGVGLNDADYPVKPTINGKAVICPFYRTWQNMLERCYSDKFKERQPTYRGCSVHPDWLVFSAFKKWMLSKDWQGKQLDKDILFVGNKVYSPETCVFVSAAINKFLTDRVNHRGEFPIGVSYDKARGKFQTHCSNPFTKKYEHLGRFTCPDLAHEAWRKRKRELALQLADLQTDQRVAAALRVRYLPKPQ